MKERCNKIAKYLIAIVVMVSIILISGYTTSFATETRVADTEISIQSILDRGNNFINNGKDKATLTEDEVAEDLIPLGRVLVAVGIAVVFVVTGIMGVKWITATPDQQATLKKQLVGLVVSIVVIFGAVGIWTLVKNIMESLTTVQAGPMPPTF